MTRHNGPRRRTEISPGVFHVWKDRAAWFLTPSVVRIIAGALVLALSLACVSVALFKWSQQHRVRNVSVTAAFEHLDPAKLQRSIDSVVRDAHWINLDVSRLRDLLTSLDWVKTATVSKSWPDSVVISLEESVPLAVWNENWIMTMDGELIERGKQGTKLPTLNGRPGRHKQASEFYQSLSTILRSVDLKVSQYDVTTALQWRLVLDNGIEVIAEEDGYVEKIRRFVHMYTSLQDFQRALISRVDTRYENGVAVKWKAELRDPA